MTIQEYSIEALRNPAEARSYLEVAFEDFNEDGDVEALLPVLRTVAEARGIVEKIVENPTISTLNPVLHQLGFKLSIVALDSHR